MNQAYLKNILSARFDFNIWKDLLDKIFPKVEIFMSVAKIVDSHVKMVVMLEISDWTMVAHWPYSVLKLQIMYRYHATAKAYAILRQNMLIKV